MPALFLRAIPAIGFVAVLSLPAAASFPPKTFSASKEDIAARCEALGDRASYTAWDYKPGEYGCVDIKTGFVLICKAASEVCKLYFPARKFPPKPQKPTAEFNRPAPAASALHSARAGRGCLLAPHRRSDA